MGEMYKEIANDEVVHRWVIENLIDKIIEFIEYLIGGYVDSLQRVLIKQKYHEQKSDPRIISFGKTSII